MTPLLHGKTPYFPELYDEHGLYFSRAFPLFSSYAPIQSASLAGRSFSSLHYTRSCRASSLRRFAESEETKSVPIFTPWEDAGCKGENKGGFPCLATQRRMQFKRPLQAHGQNAVAWAALKHSFVEVNVE
jgi:hypothetical protein